MAKLLYVYDARPGLRRDPRRVAFTKELYGYRYAWMTRQGRREGYHQGILYRARGEVVGDSAILVEEDRRGELDELFHRYVDVISMRCFRVAPATHG